MINEFKNKENSKEVRKKWKWWLCNEIMQRK
jgi:hypothetical protein